MTITQEPTAPPLTDSLTVRNGEVLLSPLNDKAIHEHSDRMDYNVAARAIRGYHESDNSLYRR